MKDLVLEPPILVVTLILCIAYFVILFKSTSNKKTAAWFELISVYLFLFIISGANFFPFDRLDPGDLGDHAKGFFSALLLLIIYGAFFLVARGKGKQIVTNFCLLFKQPFLGIYLALVIFSVFWSNNPLVTLKATSGLLFFSIYAVHFARKYNWQELAKLLRWNYTIIAIHSTFTALFVPSIGMCPKGWCGGFGHPIDLGSMMAVGISLWWLNAFCYAKYRWRSLLLSIPCLIAIQFTNSAGSLFVFFTLIILLVLSTFLRRLNFTQAFIFFIMMLGSFGSITIWLINHLEYFLLFFKKDITLTGRVPLWTLLTQVSIPEHPWLGYGYHAFWQRWRGNDSPAANVANIIIGDGRDWVAHAHNGFIDIVLNLGLIGLLIFILLFLTNIIQSIKLIINNQRPESLLPLIILTFVFMTNLFNSPIIIPSSIWFMFVTITIKLMETQSIIGKSNRRLSKKSSLT